MSGNFDWQTEDELRNQKQAVWDETPDPHPPSRPGRQIPWRLLSVLVILLAGVGLIVWWRVQARIDATMQTLRNDVASSFNLVQQSVAAGDEELFRSVLSGRDPSWTTSQLELFNAGLLIDRTPLGLTAAPGSLPQTLAVPFDEMVADDAAVVIEFTPDLNEAILTTTQPFAMDTVAGGPSTILLEQATVFRRGTQRWLLAPPEGNFWGEWQTAETSRLRVEYPQRDEAVVTRLVADLTAAIDRFCETIADINCDKEYGVTLRLDTNLDSFATLYDREGGRAGGRKISSGEDLILPAPTLIGRPPEAQRQQSESYQALLNIYLEPTLETVVVDNTGWICCEQGALFQALFDRQMAELGYKQWPINENDYQRFLAEGTRLSDLSYLWRRNNPTALDEENRSRLYAMADFLLAVFPDVSPAQIQRLLPITPNLEEWLSRLRVESQTGAGNAWVLNSLDQAWWLFALQGTLEPDTPPIPLPDDSLYLACTAEEGSQRPGPASVYRYNVGDNTWENMLNVDGFVWMSPLPLSDTLLMQEYALSKETWQNNVWRDQTRYPLYQTKTGFSISFGETDPEGRYLVTYAWEPNQEQTQAILLDLDTCTENGCDYSQLQGLPIWSPHGQLAIYDGDQRTLPNNTLITNERIIIFDPSESFSERRLTLGESPKLDNTMVTQDIGMGYAPFWLDDQTFGYIRVIRDGQPGPVVDEEIVVGTLEDMQPLPIISSRDLYEYLPENQDADRVTLAYVAPHPVDRELIFVVAVDEVQKMAYVFSYDLATHQPTLRLQVRYDLNHSFSFSPDGRYLIVTGRDRSSVSSTDDSGVLYLHNIADNTTIPFAIRLPFFLSSVTYDWTADSNWLMLAMDDNLIALVSPDHNYVQPITHNYGTCTSVAWLQE